VKVAVNSVAVDTFVALLLGFEESTVGSVVEAPGELATLVVKVHATGLVNAVPPAFWLQW
jgi:hypothetical protein